MDKRRNDVREETEREAMKERRKREGIEMENMDDEKLKRRWRGKKTKIKETGRTRKEEKTMNKIRENTRKKEEKGRI